MGIRSKLLLPLLLAIGLFAAVLHFHWAPDDLNRRQNTFMEHQHDVIKAMEGELIRLLLADDIAALRTSLAQHMQARAQYWRQLILLDNNGRRLYPRDEPVAHEGEHNLSLRRELQWDDSPVASLILTVDWSEQRAAAHDLISQLKFYVLAILGGVIGIGTLWQSTLIHRPLVRLEHVATRLAQGDFEAQLPNAGRDELGRLNHAFDSMRISLLKSQHSLQKAARIANESDIRQRAIFNNVAEGIIIVNDYGDITSCNPAAQEIFGYSNHQLVGKNITLLLTQYDDQPLDGNTPLYLDDASGQLVDAKGRKSDDAIISLELAISPMEVSQQHYYTVVVRDISARKAAEEHIRKLNEELEQRVCQRTADLQNANETLQSSLAQLRDTQKQLVQSAKMGALGSLVAGVADEVNTPVGVGVTAASHLESTANRYMELYNNGKLTRGDFEKFLTSTRESSHMILTNLQYAGQSIKSFKQIAVDQTSEEKRDIKVKEYITETLRSLHPELKKTQHTIELNCPDQLTLFNYPGALSHILTHLIMNSLTHGFEGMASGAITIDVLPFTDRIHLRYSDNGKGIDPDSLNKIFNPFFSTKDGSGLGLHIVHNIVTQTLGGQIDCRSAPGEGTTFDIIIPEEHAIALTAGSK